MSSTYSARSPVGRALYDLHGMVLSAQPGTPMPAVVHLAWHRQEVFQGEPLTA